jgi:phosphoribosyl 1,2-cyclic phosphodiesterase
VLARQDRRHRPTEARRSPGDEHPSIAKAHRVHPRLSSRIGQPDQGFGASAAAVRAAGISAAGIARDRALWYRLRVRVCVLSSGSGGNCLWVEAGGARVLVDAGLSLKETRRRCAEVGLDLRDATDLLLTHEHADHSCGAGAIARKLSLRVHATPRTLAALRDGPPEELCFPLAAGQPLLLGGLQVMPLAVPHDAADPVAYTFEERTPAGSVRAAIVTDLGSAPAKLVRALSGLDALVLEMNHDVRMLLEGAYPYRLKQRIRSDVGHLSNAQGAALLRGVLHADLRHVVLAHLSEHNNSLAHARRAAEAVLAHGGRCAEIQIAGQQRPLAPIELTAAGMARGGRAGRGFGRRPQQLSLFG